MISLLRSFSSRIVRVRVRPLINHSWRRIRPHLGVSWLRSLIPHVSYSRVKPHLRVTGLASLIPSVVHDPRKEGDTIRPCDVEEGACDCLVVAKYDADCMKDRLPKFWKNLRNHLMTGREIEFEWFDGKKKKKETIRLLAAEGERPHLVRLRLMVEEEKFVDVFIYPHNVYMAGFANFNGDKITADSLPYDEMGCLRNEVEKYDYLGSLHGAIYTLGKATKVTGDVRFALGTICQYLIEPLRLKTIEDQLINILSDSEENTPDDRTPETGDIDKLEEKWEHVCEMGRGEREEEFLIRNNVVRRVVNRIGAVKVLGLIQEKKKERM